MRYRFPFWGKLLAALAVLVLLVVIHRSDRLMFDELDTMIDRYRGKVTSDLVDRQGLFFLVTFDESPPIEWAHGAQVNQMGVETVAGVFGNARIFDGRQGTVVETASNWEGVGSQFTLSMRVWVDSRSPHQSISYSGAHRGLVGLALESSQMVFHIPPYDQQISYPFERYEEFVHLVAIADGETGQARLYENGVLMAEGEVAAVEPPEHGMQFGKTRWDVSRDTFIGILDETAVWSRVLSEQEVVDLYHARKNLLSTLRPDYYLRLRLAERMRSGLHFVMKTVDHFDPRLHPGRVAFGDVPDVNLHVSRRQSRRLREAHHHSSKTGRRVRNAARLRPVDYVITGTSGEGRLGLHGANHHYQAGRKSFELRLSPEDAGLLGGQYVRLVPPEQIDLLSALVETRLAGSLALPAVANGLCRFHLNGRLLGIYYYEAYDTLGIFPGSGDALFCGPQGAIDWGSRFSDAPDLHRSPLFGTVPVAADEIVAQSESVLEEIRPWLINDTASPLSSRAIKRKLQGERLQIMQIAKAMDPTLGAAHRLAEAMNPEWFLGANPSAFFITGNLGLGDVQVPGVDITWTSSAPEIIADAGQVTRPASGGPREVILTATLSDAYETYQEALRYRVMPAITKIPALMLYARDPLNKVARVDTIVHYYPAGENVDAPRVLTGHQETRGGLKHRGGTSYLEPKKPFSLQTDVPHQLLDDTDTRHLYFTPAYLDVTFMRNRLSYDLWRSFGSESAPRYAPTVTWAEVFVNGRYHGIYEIKTRIQWRKLGFPPYDPDREHQGQISKIIHFNHGFGPHAAGSFLQKYPNRRHGFLSDPYFSFLDDMRYLPPDASLEDIDRVMDVTNAADFHLWLNLTEGRDALHVNFYLAQEPAPGAPFFFAVFDCDKTFLSGGDRWLVNQVIERIKTADFRRHVLARWNVLRDGPASPDTLIQWVDTWEAVLADYMPWEYARWGWSRVRWGIDPELQFEDHVESLRSNIRSRFKYVDEEISRRQASRSGL